MLKKKPCKVCGGYHLMSHKKMEEYKSGKHKIAFKKKVVQDNITLTQPDCFKKAWEHYKGLCFLTDKPVPFDLNRSWQYMHVLSKGSFKWFKYYWKNIVLCYHIDIHTVYDQGTSDDLEERKHNYPNEIWDELFKLREELIIEYREWVKYHKNEYKL